MLDLFITSKTRRKIITVFTKYPDYRVHVRGLAKLTKEDPGNVQRELSKLEKAGFVKSAKESNTKVYYANPKFLLYKELQSMVLKSQARR
jgi:DNA-binding MarR family transcriptional regulator